ncbi:MAG: cytochrome-c peroxidase [Yoonia sp.]
MFLGANLAMAQGIGPDDYIPVNADQARIGQLLFYDKILSGNKNISCGTCHHHDHASGDGLSLGIGEGGVGIGPQRTTGTGPDAIRKRIPRNAPSLWNLGHNDIETLFHDGRLTRSDIYGNGYDSPAEEWLPEGLDNLVAAQSLFPMVAQFEMAGNPRENEIAGATHDRIDVAWPIIAKRVRTIPAYGAMFVQAFDHILEQGFMQSGYAEYYSFEDYLYLAYGVQNDVEMMNSYIKRTLEPLFIYDYIMASILLS